MDIIKVPYIDKIDQGKKVEEEQKTASEDEEEHYVEALKYNEIMKLLSDAQLVNTLLNVGACYPKLMK